MSLTNQDLIERSGFAYTDFKQAGVKMTTAQWTDFIAALIPQVEQWMSKYCNVATFDPTSPLNPIMEIQSGSGASNYDDATQDYNPQDIVYYLRNLYLNDGSLVVMEDTAPKSLPPAWILRYLRPGAARAEVDTLSIMNSPTTNGNITFILGGVTSYNVAVTAGMSAAQVIAAIVAAGPHTDANGVVWTVAAGTLPDVTFTASVTGPVTKVSLNTGITGLGYYWTQTVQGNNVSGGDYEVDITNGLVRVIYYNNIPRRGIRNVKFTYKTGYPINSPQYAELQGISTRACVNFLAYTKMMLAAQTIQVSGVEDIVKLWAGLSEKTLLSNGVKEDLDRYVRYPIEGQMFHDLIYGTAPLGGGI